jgi:hypothetical protein
MGKDKKNKKNALGKGLLDSIRRANTMGDDVSTSAYETKVVSSVIINDIERFRNTVGDRNDRLNAMVSNEKYLNTSNLTEQQFNSVKELITNSSATKGLEGYFSQNESYFALMRDAELVKRCIPQVAKVIRDLENNIVSPEGFSKDSFKITLKATNDPSSINIINNLKEKYKLDKKYRTTVSKYLTSVDYVLVTPYGKIFQDMEKNDKLSESAFDEITDNMNNYSPLSSKIKNAKGTSLCESTYFVGAEIKEENRGNINNAISKQLDNIEIGFGATAHIYKDLINETAVLFENSLDKYSTKAQFSNDSEYKMDLFANKPSKGTVTQDGLLDGKTLSSVSKMGIKGAYVESLDPTKVLPFEIRDKKIGYFVLEGDPRKAEKITDISALIKGTLQGSQNKAGSQYENIENGLIKTIGEKLIKSINPKFITNNIDDMDIIYSFIKENQVHTNKSKVTFIHADDICEFRRSDGSIMKDGMFFCKLYMLILVTNVMAKVTRGTDRYNHYISSGLSADVEKGVQDAIFAMQQGQFKFNDVTSINKIFSMVGSMVDLFIPQSQDGVKPIQTEIVSGQDIDMNEPFLEFLKKSIVTSFCVPSVTVDYTDEVEFAKTLSMANIDVARSTLYAQAEIYDPQVKLVRLIAKYELDDDFDTDLIDIVQNSPISILLENTTQILETAVSNATSLAQTILPTTASDEERRLFTYEYIKDKVPIDFVALEKIVEKIHQSKIESDLSSKITDAESQ